MQVAFSVGWIILSDRTGNRFAERRGEHEKMVAGGRIRRTGVFRSGVLRAATRHGRLGSSFGRPGLPGRALPRRARRTSLPLTAAKNGGRKFHLPSSFSFGRRRSGDGNFREKRQMNNVLLLSFAMATKLATPATSSTSMSSSRVMPMRFMAISQATKRTPSARACSRSSGREVTF